MSLHTPEAPGELPEKNKFGLEFLQLGMKTDSEKYYWAYSPIFRVLLPGQNGSLE
jgi:hypothetical protein